MVSLLVPVLLKGAAIVTAVLIPTVGVMGARHVGRSWNLKEFRAREEQLRALAEESVLNSYQQFKDVVDDDSRHQRKLETALATLLSSADAAGIELDAERARPKIEAAVSRLKRTRETRSLEDDPTPPAAPTRRARPGK